MKKLKNEIPNHPIGIQPMKKLLNNTKYTLKEEYRARSLGILDDLSDETISLIFSFIDPKDLISIAYASQYFYAFSNSEDTWRKITIDYCSKEKTTFYYYKSWKQTYLNLIGNTFKRREIKLICVYSDFLFTSWYYRNLDLSSCLNFDNIPREDHATFSLVEFQNKYESINKPVIIKNLVNKWKAYTQWDIEYLIEQYKDKIFEIEAVQLRLDEYINYFYNNIDESPLYLFDKNFCTNCPKITSEFEVPIYFENDYFSLLKDDRPDYRWLIIGPKRSGSTFHKDPNATSAWNAVISGRKKWILIPPNILPPGVFVNEDESEVTAPISICDWFENFYPQLKQLRKEGLVYEGICNKGEVIFVPSGWWHLVLNIDDSIAITQNFVSKFNVEKVLRFLVLKKDQISGVHKNVDLLRRFSDLYKSIDPKLMDEILNPKPIVVKHVASIGIQSLEPFKFGF